MASKVGKDLKELRRKSLSQCKSTTSKQSKDKLGTNKLDNLRIDNINLEKKPFKQELTVKTVKK